MTTRPVMGIGAREVRRLWELERYNREMAEALGSMRRLNAVLGSIVIIVLAGYLIWVIIAY